MSKRTHELIAAMREIDAIVDKYALTNGEFVTLIGGLVGEMKRPDHVTLKQVMHGIETSALRLILARNTSGGPQ